MVSFTLSLLPIQGLFGADIRSIDSLLNESTSVQYD